MLKILVYNIVLLLITSQSLAQEAAVDYYPPSGIPDRIILSLTEKPNKSMAVNWRTDTTVNRAFVHLAIATPTPTFSDSKTIYEGRTEVYESDNNKAHYHSAIMDDLLPNTKYAYREGDSWHGSEWSHFKTAPLKGKPLSFIYF